MKKKKTGSALHGILTRASELEPLRLGDALATSPTVTSFVEIGTLYLYMCAVHSFPGVASVDFVDSLGVLYQAILPAATPQNALHKIMLIFVPP